MRAYAGTRVASCAKYKRDKFVRPYVGYENMRTGEIQWYNQGIYLVNNPQWSYNASTNEISMQALDLMSKLTGLRNGNLEGIPTKIAKDENVREAIIKTIELGGFTKYICEECKTKDGTIVPVPYDIEIDVGGTIYDILTGLRDIMPNYQIYFDINGVFHYEPIPLAYDDPVLIDDDLFNNVLISENINTDFESVKNYVEVLGHTWDVDYYSPPESTTVAGGTITPTFADLKELQNDTAVGITLPSDIGENSKILPDGYIQLDYIQSSGTQYIDTGFKPNQDTRLIIAVDFSQTVAWKWIFGARQDASLNAFGFLLQENSKYRFDYGASTNNLSYNPTGNITIDINKNNCYINNTLASTATYTNFTTPVSCFLFGNNNNGTYRSGATLKMYSCKIYDNGALVRNFIPCKNPSGVVGLYDVVGNQFYQNNGTGSFTAGPETPSISVDKITINYLGNNDVVDIDDKPIKELSKDTEWIFQYVAGSAVELEYIEASGTQYIDTGFKPNSNTRVVCKVSSDQGSSSSHPYIFGAGIAYGNTAFEASTWTAAFGNNSTTTAFNIADNQIHVIDFDKNVVKIDNITKWTSSGTFNSNFNLYLFGWNLQGSLSGSLIGRIYECSIYDNGNLVRSFVPWRDENGNVGMYDTLNSKFYTNSGTGKFTPGPVIGEESQKDPFWRFMGHQQAQAISYDNNPSSPFYVGDPIGSSSVGRIRIVLYGGEYDNIYSDDLAKQRADFEIYQRSRLNDSISMETIPIPWMDANIVISHRFGQKQEPSKYIVKSFSVDYATGGTMTINAISWYPYYEESEVV